MIGVTNGGGGQVLGAATFSPAPGEQCSEFLNSYMGPGRNNDPEQVKRLQQILLNEGFAVTVNGEYDDATLEAVKAFQLKYTDEILKPWGLTQPTGFVFLTTRKKLNELYCQATSQTFPLSKEEQAIIDGYKKGQDNGGSTGGSGGGSAPDATQPDDNTTPAGEPTNDTNDVNNDSQVGAAGAADDSGGFWGRVRGFFGF